MPYATVDDAKKLYGEDYVLVASDRDADGTEDADPVARAFEDASSEIDSYLSQRYDVPVSPTPAILRRICVDIAVYQIGPEAGTLTEEKRKRYEDAVRWLRDVSAGKAGLGLDNPADNEHDLPEVSETTQPRQFTRTTMRGL